MKYIFYKDKVIPWLSSIQKSQPYFYDAFNEVLGCINTNRYATKHIAWITRKLTLAKIVKESENGKWSIEDICREIKTMAA